jgi:hypothetical protein
MALKKLRSGKNQENDWSNPQVLGAYLFECIENLENMGMYATVEESPGSLTCMDYLLETMSAHGNKRVMRPVFVEVNKNSYNGNNGELRSRLQLGLYDFPHYPRSTGSIISTDSIIMNFGDAIAEFYIKNSHANPVASHCSVSIDDPDAGWITSPVNCLTKIIEMDKNNTYNIDYNPDLYKYFATDPFLDIINSGARCGVFDATTYNGVDMYDKTSCLEVVMNREVNRAQWGSFALPLGGFGYNIDKYNMSLDCIADEGKWQKKTIPCIQKLVQAAPFAPSKYGNYIKSFDRAGTYAEKIFRALLSKKYKFEKTHADDLPESTLIDYIVNDGENLWNIDISTVGELCVSHDGATPISCFAKMLMNLRDNETYYDYDKSQLILHSMEARDPTRVSKAILYDTCYDGDEPTPCLSTLIDIVSKQQQLKGIFLRIMDESPLTDFICSEKHTTGNGVTFRTMNCLDKVIGSSTNQMMELIKGSELLLDRYDCTDWNGDAITCIDKLFQRHEMWVHNLFRAREISKLNNYFTGGEGKEKAIKDTDELDVISKRFNLDEDPGYRVMASEYDPGNSKVHSPSKTFGEFKHVLESQLEDYKIQFPGNNPPLRPTAEGVRYTQELIRSITSDKSSKEIQIVPKLYKMVDVYSQMFYGGLELDYNRIGIKSMIGSGRPSPLTLNMFECRDVDSGKTISCIQKQIDFVNWLALHNFSVDAYVDPVMTYKDLFKPDMCTQLDTGQKMTCMEYAYNRLNKYWDDASYISLISRKDFNKIADVKIDTPKGKMNVLDAVCNQSSLRGIAYYLHETKTAATVTNGNPSFDGTALSIYGQRCACADKKTPLDRRICMDTECFNTYVSKNHWSNKYIGAGLSKGTKGMLFQEGKVRDAMFPQIYHDSQDYFNLGGVYEITYKPSEYRITSTERFNYDDAVLGILFPAIKRVEGMKLARFGDKKNVKIEDITLLSPNPDHEDYVIQVVFTEIGTGDPGEEKGWIEHYLASTIFLRGGLLNRDDIRMKAIRYKNESDTVEKIMTRGAGASTSTSKIKLIISNRPADFMRASTCQDWSSCMNIENGMYNSALPFYMSTGGYVAYLASDELAPNWYARSLMIPAMRYKRGDKHESGDDDDDPNNTFRVNSVYGISMYKPLLKDAIQIILRDNGYNEPNSFVTGGDSEEFILNETNIKKIKNDIWMNNRKEAYRNCLEKILKGESVNLPNANVATTPEDCEKLTKTLKHGGFRMEDIYAKGLISDRFFRRFEVMSEWDTSYLDAKSIPEEIKSYDLDYSKDKVSIQYLNPITVPTEET